MKKNNKGSTLVTVLIVMVVVSILGATILSVGLSATRISAYDEKRMQAFYLARAGADATASWLLDPANLHAVNTGNYVPPTDASTPNEGTGNLNGKTFNLKVYRKTTAAKREIIIESTAIIDNVKGKASIKIIESQLYANSQVFAHAISGMSTVTMGGNFNITGSVEIPSDTSVSIHGGSGTISSGLSINPNMDYPPKLFPDPLTLLDRGSVNIDADTVISSPGRYDILNVRQANLTFDTTGGDLVIMVNQLFVQGNMSIKVKGTGKLMMYVNGDSDTGSLDVDIAGSVICYDSLGNQIAYDAATGRSSIPITFYMWMKPQTSVRLPGNADFWGYIYAPGSEIDVNGCDGVYGSVIGNMVGTQGTTNFTYVPNATGTGSASELEILRFSKGEWIDD